MSTPLTAPRPAAPAVEDFRNDAKRRVFRFRYEGEPRPLHAFLLERYRFGRDAHWAATFYPQRVRLNGAPVDAHTQVAHGGEIAYLHLRADEPPAPPLGAPLHEDPWLLAIAKGDALPVSPSGVFYFTALAVRAREVLGEPELTPLHRLDLETSGPLLLARRKADLPAWHALFARKALHKRYRALVHGRFPRGLDAIAGRIVPDAASRIHTRLRLEPVPPAEAEAALRAAAARPRKAAPELSLTRVRAVTWHDLGARGTFSELELEPVTGKTNQLRVHLAHVGHPIVGDKKYHPDEAVFLDWHAHRDFARLAGRLLLPRQALHCEALAFAHPFSGEALQIRAPADMWRAKVAGLLGEGVGRTLSEGQGAAVDETQGLLQRAGPLP
jgi:tRNA pseudouridine32 synthase / 23S rRNA pseudouridine746 synthase